MLERRCRSCGLRTSSNKSSFSSTRPRSSSSKRRFSFDTRTLFSREDGEEGTFELVDLYNPCLGGMNMPSKIWVRLGELPMSTLAWAMGSGILDSDKSRQIDLSQWIGKPTDNTIIPNDIMALPGPPSRAYTFED